MVKHKKIICMMVFMALGSCVVQASDGNNVTISDSWITQKCKLYAPILLGGAAMYAGVVAINSLLKDRQTKKARELELQEKKMQEVKANQRHIDLAGLSQISVATP